MGKQIAGMEFNSLEAETHRVYTFPGGHEVRVDSPLWLNVSKSGGHRIITSFDPPSTVYVPAGWLSLQWWNKPGLEPLQF